MCKKNNLHCHIDAVCTTNNDGFPICTCKDGLEGDGMDCTAPVGCKSFFFDVGSTIEILGINMCIFRAFQKKMFWKKEKETDEEN